jgi:hypothetical protein
MKPTNTDQTPPQSDDTTRTDSTLNRRAFLGALGAAGLGAIAGCTSASKDTTNASKDPVTFETGGNETQLRQAAAIYLDGTATMYKVPLCNCCLEYKKYLESTTQAQIKVNKVNDLARIKDKYNIPKKVESCHTLDTGDYYVEGHVPREAIGKLAKKTPAIAGIALPGMPTGSPGMGGQKTEEFVIYAVEKDGSYHEFMRI